MAYNTPPTKSAGNGFTAAEWNTYIRDNMAAGVPDIFAAAGDMAIASAPDVAVRLPIGALGDILRVSAGGSPEWGGLVTQRKGGGASNWNGSGSTIYTPARTLVQVGAVDVTIGSNAAITFPIAFSANPLIFCTPQLAITTAVLGVTVFGMSASGVTIYLAASAGSGSVTVYWLAIGPA